MFETETLAKQFGLEIEIGCYGPHGPTMATPLGGEEAELKGIDEQPLSDKPSLTRCGETYSA